MVMVLSLSIPTTLSNSADTNCILFRRVMVLFLINEILSLQSAQTFDITSNGTKIIFECAEIMERYECMIVTDRQIDKAAGECSST